MKDVPFDYKGTVAEELTSPHNRR